MIAPKYKLREIIGLVSIFRKNKKNYPFSANWWGHIRTVSNWLIFTKCTLSIWLFLDMLTKPIISQITTLFYKALILQREIYF